MGSDKSQIDVDSVSARLDQHVSDIGLLARSFDDCSDSAGSGQESTRNLLTWLQIGNSESRNSAMDSLLRFLYEEDKNVPTAVDEGLVPVLVNLLDSTSVEIKEKAVSAISRVSTFHGCKTSLLSQCPLLIAHLLRILDSRNGFAREKACFALQAPSFSEEHAKIIGCRNGMASLLDVFQSGTPYSRAYATGVLRNVSGFAKTRRFFVEESYSAIPGLISMAGLGTFIAQGNSVGCLNTLVSEDESLKLVVGKEGGIRCLKSFWTLRLWFGALRSRSNC